MKQKSPNLMQRKLPLPPSGQSHLTSKTPPHGHAVRSGREQRFAGGSRKPAMFPRNSADKYDPKMSVIQSEDAIYDEFLEILQDVERTSRPISFETLDIVAGNREADKVVSQLIGREVD